MLTIEPRALLKLLTPTCTRALEEAVGICVRRSHREVGIRHLLLALLDDTGSDVVVLLERGGADVAAALGAVQGSLDLMQKGDGGRPVFSPHLLQVMEDAWHSVAPVHAQKRVRSGALVAVLARDPTRYAEVALLAQLSAMISGLDTHVPGDLVQSREDAESRLDAPRPEPPRLPRETLVHRVAPGETLLDIARRFAIDVEDVARANDLGIHDPLSPGATLRLRVLPRDVVPRDVS